MKKYKVLLAVLIVSLIGLVGLAAYTDYRVSDDKGVTTAKKESSSKTEPDTTTVAKETTTEKKEEKKYVSLVAVGDNLIHIPLLTEGKNDDGSYDFSFLYEIMKEDFLSADIAVINQESVIGGEDLGYDGYPNFNSPDEVADAIVDAGFDVVLHASNHAMDVGTAGIKHSISYWKSKGDAITMLGFNESEAELCAPKYIEKNGIKIAMFNYTYGLNGYSLPEGETHLVNLLVDENKDRIVEQIQKADKEADFVIVFPHWGNEDWLGDVSDFQIHWANIFTDAGADLIIGTHPHVLEKIEWIKTEAGNKSLCYYSIGNYISNQQELNEVLGGMAKVTIVKDGDKTQIVKKKTGIVPTVTQNDRRGAKPLIQTYRLTDYTEEMAKIHDIYNRFDSSFSAEKLNQTALQVVGDWIIK